LEMLKFGNSSWYQSWFTSSIFCKNTCYLWRKIMDYHFYFFVINYFQERKINALDDSCFFWWGLWQDQMSIMHAVTKYSHASVGVFN
jgi:hypothetical protein